MISTNLLFTSEWLFLLHFTPLTLHFGAQPAHNFSGSLINPSRSRLASKNVHSRFTIHRMTKNATLNCIQGYLQSYWLNFNSQTMCWPFWNEPTNKLGSPSPPVQDFQYHAQSLCSRHQMGKSKEAGDCFLVNYHRSQFCCSNLVSSRPASSQDYPQSVCTWELIEIPRRSFPHLLL